MRLHHSILGLFFGLFLALVSCQKNSSDEPAPAPAEWQAAQGFLYSNRIAHNSAIWDDQLYVVTDKFLNQANAEGGVTSTAHWLEIGLPLPLNRDFLVGADVSQHILTFAPSRNPATSNAKRVSIMLKDLANDNISFGLGLNRWSFGDNGKGQILAILMNDRAERVPYLFEVKMKNQGSYVEVSEVVSKRVELPNWSPYSTVTVAGDGFLVPAVNAANQKVTLMIDASGNAKVVASDAIFKTLPLGNKLYAAGTSGIYVSADQGNSWTIDNASSKSLASIDLSLMQGYAQIDNRLVMHTSSNIYEIKTMADGSIQRTEINQDGLEGNTLINLHEWEGQVFAVTQTGVYLRQVNDFFK